MSNIPTAAIPRASMLNPSSSQPKARSKTVFRGKSKSTGSLRDEAMSIVSGGEAVSLDIDEDADLQVKLKVLKLERDRHASEAAMHQRLKYQLDDEISQLESGP